jgi:hypothetical protein
MGWFFPVPVTVAASANVIAYVPGIAVTMPVTL